MRVFHFSLLLSSETAQQRQTSPVSWLLFNFWGTVLEQLLGNFGSTVFTALLMLLIMIVSLTLGLVLFSIGGKNKAARIKAKQFASIPTAQ